MAPEKKSIITGTIPKIINPIVPSTPKPYWRVGDFDELITDFGYDAYIDRALRCPCADKTTGSAQSTCKNCLGRGWFFINRLSTKVVSQGMSNTKKFNDFGETNRGIAKITVRGTDKLGFMDRIVLLELEAFYSEILRPFSYSGEIVAYPVYEPLNITDIFLFISGTQKLMPLSSNDYTVNGNRIVFNPGIGEYVESRDMTQEASDVNISIRYSYRPVYHVLDVNRELMKVRDYETPFSDEKLKSMPINVLCRKAHFLFGEQIYGDNLFDNTVR